MKRHADRLDADPIFETGRTLRLVIRCTASGRSLSHVLCGKDDAQDFLAMNKVVLLFERRHRNLELNGQPCFRATTGSQVSVVGSQILQNRKIQEIVKHSWAVRLSCIPHTHTKRKIADDFV